MTARSRGYNQDWNPMQDDYDTTYDSQYPDDDVSGGVQLDHSKLYVKNISKALSEDGLKTAFAKYGNVVKVYLSRDPLKRYALITFETPGEAKLAMMKLNKTEPLRLNIHVAHKKNNQDSSQTNHRRQTRESTNNSYREDTGSVSSKGHYSRKQEEYANGENIDEYIADEDLGMDEALDPDLAFELEHLRLQRIKLQEEEVQCKQRLLLLNRAGKKQAPQKSNRSILPDGRIVVRNTSDRHPCRKTVTWTLETTDNTFNSGAGDSRALKSCSCQERVVWNEQEPSESSTASTCVLCCEDRSVKTAGESSTKIRCEISPSKHDKTHQSSIFRSVDLSKLIDKKDSRCYTDSSKNLTKSDYSKVSETVSKRSDVTSKRDLARKSEMTCDFVSEFYSDDDEDETNRLIQLRHADYLDIVDDKLKIVLALSGYPKSKMRLRQMEEFQRSLNDIMEMQLKAGLLKKTPCFVDYYLNRGALVCICKDAESRDWMVRISAGLQERMCNNLILLKAKVKRLCLAVIKIPKSCWPATAQDAFKLLQYFNPSLKTHAWKIYAQKFVNDVECTSFLVDRVSGEIIRGPNFKNIIDYNQMEFELTGYTEIYYECFLADMGDDLSSIASRVKLLEELRSTDATPRNKFDNSKVDLTQTKENVQENESDNDVQSSKETFKIEDTKNENDNVESAKIPESSAQNEKFDEIKNEIEYDEQDIKNDMDMASSECKIDANESIVDVNESAVAVSEKTESIIESSENLVIGRNSNLNIDSNRGIAYHRRTNYLHVENELKVAVVLEGYPQNKLEGTHIRRLKHLFKEYVHKDMKMQRFANLIIPKFQDVFLSNGAVIYICDSLETKDYLNEVLPKFINSTGLKLVFRDIRNLVRYTRIVMRLPKEFAHIESHDILAKLKEKYPNLKPDCWKYYSDVAGKQKRQFGVDPESLDIIKSSDFDPVYEDEKLNFRIIDRQKRDVSFEERVDFEESKEVESAEAKKIRSHILKIMYCPIDPEIMNSSLTRIRTNHYSDLIDDDLKLYVGPVNYPEIRIDETSFHSFKKAIENIVFESHDSGTGFIPKFHDMYLFDGVIFIICKDQQSRLWIEDNINTVNSNSHSNLKATEFRGAVGIVSMVVKNAKNTEDVIATLQMNNPRLRTKFWRKISTVHSRTRLDVVLQIDKLSAQVISSTEFHSFVGDSDVQFKLGHLKSLIKPKHSLEALTKAYLKKHNSDVVKKVEKEVTKVVKSFADLKLDVQKENDIADKWEEFTTENNDRMKNYKDFKLNPGEKVFFYTDFDAKSEERDSVRSFYIDSNEQGYCKMILKVPTNILPESKDGLEIIFDLLEDKNPGLNTELWKIEKRSQYNKGKFNVLIDKQSASVIRGKQFDPTLGGERLKFVF